MKKSTLLILLALSLGELNAEISIQGSNTGSQPPAAVPAIVVIPEEAVRGLSSTSDNTHTIRLPIGWLETQQTTASMPTHEPSLTLHVLTTAWRWMFPISEKTSLGIGVATSTASLDDPNGTSTPSLMFQQSNGSHTDRKTSWGLSVSYLF